MNPKKQKSPYQNPWPWWTQVLLICWRLSWLGFCRWTPKFFNPWRLLILKVFGAKISGIPFVHSSVIIKVPWHLTLHHRACLGEKANVYSLGQIELHENVTVAQEVYLCSGTHDIHSPVFQLITKEIEICSNAFVGARAMILPGVRIGKNAVVGAMAVVAKNVGSNTIVVGNPASNIGSRKNYD